MSIMEIDHTNIEILRHLKDGRKSFKLIAEALSVTENTIRSRVNKLLDEGILNFSGNIEVDALPGHSLLYLGIKLKSMDLKNKASQFSQLKGVVSAGIVTGRYDIILQVLLGSEYSLLEFITEQVATIEDVQTVESFIVFKGYNLKVPYIL
jgi:Lrp/AsnC family transcriptional regulator for asnA, asnC and gidA